MTTLHKNEREQLQKLLVSLGDFHTRLDFASKVEGVLDFVIAHYTEPTRHYHTLAHINECINGLHWMMPPEDPETPERVRDRKIAELALWYHDLVYDPKLHNNEEMSVAILKADANTLHLDPGIVDAACSAIMATRHAAPAMNDVDRLVVDLDLNILRTPEERFDQYERDVREEYAFVDDARWIAGRTAVLQYFLDRPWVYETPTFRKLYEGDARANLKRSIARLARGEVLRRT